MLQIAAIVVACVYLERGRILEKSQSKFKIKAGILAASSLQMAPIGLVSIVPMLMAHYANANPTTVQIAFTIPTLMTVPVSLIIGALASKTGKKIPLLAGIALIFLCGMIPAFVDLTLPMFLVIMAGIGVGIGCIMPTATGLIADHFVGPEQGDVMGKQSAFTNLGGMLLAFVGGALVTGGWQKTFFIFLYTIPIFLIVFLCIPQDKRATSDSGASEPVPKTKLSGEVYAMCAMIFIFGITFGVLNTNAALLVGERSLGDPSTASFATSAMTAIGIVVGLIYGMIAKLCKKLTLPVAFALFACGMLLMGNATSAILFYIGNVVSGIGFSMAIPTALSRTAQSVDPGSATFAISMFLSTNCVAMFLSPIIMNPVSQAISTGTAQSRYNIGAIAVIALCVVSFIYVLKEKTKATQAA